MCPEDWSACPKVSGVDWVALEELEPLAAPSAEALDACHEPESLLSPRAVPGMNLVCVLPPPAEGGAVATLAVFPRMQRSRAATPLVALVPPRLKKVRTNRPRRTVMHPWLLQ